MKKSPLTLSQMQKCKPELVAEKDPKGWLVEPDDQPKYPTADLTQQGFYFVVDGFDEVVARFYIGRQRSKCGLEAVFRHIRSRRSAVCHKLMDANQWHEIWYVPSERMKPITTAVGKGTIGTLVTRSHNDRFQNLEEMNRMLNDVFTFKYQKH